VYIKSFQLQWGGGSFAPDPQPGCRLTVNKTPKILEKNTW